MKKSFILFLKRKKKMNENWNKIYVRKSNLQLHPTLGGGQSFRWKNIEGDKWIGVFKNRVWVLSQTENYISYQCFEKSLSKEQDEMFKTGDLSPSTNCDEKAEDLLKSYFRLDFDLEHHYKIWSKTDPYFREAAPKLHGIRILNQEVTENIFSFICSSNNNIKRISSMIEKLCENYGEPITEINNQIFYCFPTVERLTNPEVESDLRKAGFGYRAKFIHRSACMIKKFGGSVWLNNLKLLSYEDAKKELMKLPGVGAKVADCICLMSLGHLEAVPVDTHIFQVATKIYLPHLKKYKSLTDKIYNEIADHYRSLHGSYAGWANTVAAKKGSSEEDDRLGPYGPWMNGRPGRGPKPFKFKNPKHHIQFPVYVVSAPEYAGNRPMPTQQPQYVQEMPGPQPMNGFDIQQYFENIQRNMAKVSEKVYSEFQSVDAEIERNRQNMENALINQFKNMQSMLFAKRAKEIQAAVKEGKDQEKIESCLKDQEEVFKAEVNMDVKRNSDCLNDATFRARQTLNGARNLYTEKSAMNAYQVKDLAHEMNACVNQGDYHCAYEKMAAINQRIKATVEEGAKQLEKIQDAPRQQMIQATYCRQNFMQDFREMRAEYNDLVKKCVSSVEVPKLPVEVPQVPVQVPEVPAVEVPKVPEVAPELPSAEVESNEEIDA